MKYNLKNRPKTCHEDEICMADLPLSEWFEGFEKELREMMDNEEVHVGGGIAASHLIADILDDEEILGEDSS